MNTLFERYANYFYQGYCAHQADNLLIAKLYYYSYLRHVKKNSDVWYLVGICHLELREFAEAYYGLKKALLLDPRNSGYWMGLGLYYALIGKEKLSAYCCNRTNHLDEECLKIISLVLAAPRERSLLSRLLFPIYH